MKVPFESMRQGISNLGRPIAFLLLGLCVLAAWSHSLLERRQASTPSIEECFPHQQRHLFSQLPSAEALLLKGDEETPCDPWNGARFLCGKAHWQYVGPTIAQVEGEWATCVWAHPYDTKVLRIRFPSTLMGAAIGGKMAFVGKVPNKGAAVHLDFRANGQSLGRQTLKSKEKGWQEIEIETKSWIGRKTDLEIDIRTPKAYRRQFCFDPILIDASPEGPNG